MAAGPHIGQEDPHLAVAHLAQRAAVLPAHPGRVLPLLGKARLVDDDHPLGIPQVLRHVGVQPVPRLVRRPDRAPQQVLEAVGRGVAGRLGQLPAVLAPGVAQEAVQVGAGPLPGLRPPEAGGQPSVDLGPLGLPAAHGGRAQGNGLRQGLGPGNGCGHRALRKDGAETSSVCHNHLQL